MTSQLHDVPTEVAELDEVHAAEPAGEYSKASNDGLPPGLRLITSNAGLPGGATGNSFWMNPSAGST